MAAATPMPIPALAAGVSEDEESPSSASGGGEAEADAEADAVGLVGLQVTGSLLDPIWMLNPPLLKALPCSRLLRVPISKWQICGAVSLYLSGRTR